MGIYLSRLLSWHYYCVTPIETVRVTLENFIFISQGKSEVYGPAPTIVADPPESAVATKDSLILSQFAPIIFTLTVEVSSTFFLKDGSK